MPGSSVGHRWSSTSVSRAAPRTAPPESRWPVRKVFSLIGPARSPRSPAGASPAPCGEEVERGGGTFSNSVVAAASPRAPPGPARRGNRRRCAGPRPSPPARQLPGRAPPPCSPGSAPPCRTCARAGRRPAGQPCAGRDHAAAARRGRHAHRARGGVRLARNAASFFTTAGSVIAIIATANSQHSPPWPRRWRTSPMGIPLGICTIECSESSPRRVLDGTGTPRTGTVVFAASMPGRRGAVRARDDHLQAARTGVPRIRNMSSGIRCAERRAASFGDPKGPSWATACL